MASQRPSPPGDALDTGHANTRRLLRRPPRAASYHPPCSYPHWLRPQRHAKQQHLAQRPDVLRQSSGHRWRPWLPALGRARAMRRPRLRQRLAYTGVGQAEIIVHVIQGQLLAYAVLALAECGDTPSHRRHMLTDGHVDALDECRVDLPAMGRQPLLDRPEGAEDDAVLHVD